MKLSGIVLAILVTQVSASFFDVFQGAVLSVQNSFGKLLSDVVTDVKETVDCTILAVEHVLSLSDGANDHYYEKCKTGSTAVQTPPVVTPPPKFDVIFEEPKDLGYFKKNISEEIDAKINDTLSKMLSRYDIRDKLGNVEEILAKETDRLADVSSIVKQELGKLSSEVTSDFRRIEENYTKPTVENILGKINLLQDRERIGNNSSEAIEIHKVVDKVSHKLDVMAATEASENVKLEEILNDLEANSNDSFIELDKKFAVWKEEKSTYLEQIKNKMEEENEISKHLLTFKDVTNHIYSGNTNSQGKIYETLSSSTPPTYNFSNVFSTSQPSTIASTSESLTMPSIPESSTFTPISELTFVPSVIPSVTVGEAINSSENLPTTDSFIIPSIPQSSYIQMTSESSTILQRYDSSTINSISESSIPSTFDLKSKLSKVLLNSPNSTLPSISQPPVITSTSQPSIIKSTSTYFTTPSALESFTIPITSQPFTVTSKLESSTIPSTAESFTLPSLLEFYTIPSKSFSNLSTLSSVISSSTELSTTLAPSQSFIPLTSDSSNTGTISRSSTLPSVSQSPTVPESFTISSTSESSPIPLTSESSPIPTKSKLSTFAAISESSTIPSTVLEAATTSTTFSTDIPDINEPASGKTMNSSYKKSTVNKPALAEKTLHEQILTGMPKDFINRSTDTNATDTVLEKILKNGENQSQIILIDSSEQPLVGEFVEFASTTQHKTSNKNITVPPKPVVNGLSVVLTTDKPTISPQNTKNIKEKISVDYEAFLKKATNSAYHNKAAKEARKLIEDSKKTHLIINSILKNRKSARSVFNNYPVSPNFR